MHVSFLTQGASSSPSSSAAGAPVVVTGGDAPDTSHGSSPGLVAAAPTVAGSAWRNLSDLPQAVQDNASGYYRGPEVGVIAAGGSVLAYVIAWQAVPILDSHARLSTNWIVLQLVFGIVAAVVAYRRVQ